MQFKKGSRIILLAFLPIIFLFFVQIGLADRPGNVVAKGLYYGTNESCEYMICLGYDYATNGQCNDLGHLPYPAICWVGGSYVWVCDCYIETSDCNPG
jgi:hypothetical protein